MAYHENSGHCDERGKMVERLEAEKRYLQRSTSNNHATVVSILDLTCDTKSHRKLFC